MSYCPTCKDYMIFPERHTCAPKWEAQDSEECTDDDWTVIHECDEESAAAKYAQQSDDRCGDGPRERIVIVRAPGRISGKRFSISWEHSIDYFARPEA